MIQITKDNQQVRMEENIQELDFADIVVVGGGITGVAAALQAAESGKRVVLVEKNTFVGSLCDAGVEHWEAAELSEITGKIQRWGRECLPQELLEQLLEKNVILYLHTMAVEVVQSGRQIEAVIVATKRGLQMIRAGFVIDATGDGILCKAAGAKGKTVSKTARITFGMGNVDYECAENWLRENRYSQIFWMEGEGTEKERGECVFYLKEWKGKENKVSLQDGKLRFSFYGKNRISQISGLTYEMKSTEEAEAMIILSDAASQTADYLKQHMGGFENAYLDWTAPCVEMSGGFLPKGQKEKDGLVKGFGNLASTKLIEEDGPNRLVKDWNRGKKAAMLASSFGKGKKQITGKNKTQFRRKIELPVEKECDVLVAGGGAAGIVSAIASARKGMKTILLERNAVLGGDLLAGGLSWLGFYNLYREFKVPPKQVVFGIGYEITQRLLEMGGSPGFYEDIAPFTQECKGTHGDRECMKRLFFHMAEEAGVEILTEALFMEAVVEEENYILGNVIRGAVVQERGRRYVIKTKVAVDASGDGDVAWHAGANCKEYPSHGVGMAFGMTNVDFDKALHYAREKNAVAHEAYGQAGGMKDKLVKYSLRTYFIPELLEDVQSSGIHNSFCIESCHEGEASYINGVTTPQSNILDPRKATDTIIDLRRRLFKASDFLKRRIPGFEEAQMSWCTPIPGARQSRCVDCRYSISGEDVENGIIPEDTIGLFGGHDGHYAGYKIKNGGWYGIPYRAMLPHFIRNVFVVGRMLSADWAAYMSTRLNVSCFIQGQAAGTAAAKAIRDACSIDRVNVKELQEELRADGVYLG